MKMDMKKLGKLKMPGKREELPMPKDEASDLEEGSPEEESLESPDEEAAELDAGAPEDNQPNDQLDSISDDELLAEIKKRGLMSKLADKGEAEADSGDDQSMYS